MNLRLTRPTSQTSPVLLVLLLLGTITSPASGQTRVFTGGAQSLYSAELGPAGPIRHDVGPTTLPDGNVRSLAADPVGERIYWLDPSRDLIMRADHDVTTIEIVMASGPDPDRIAIDAVGRMIYWSSRGTREIRRAMLDGTGVQVVVPAFGSGTPSGLAIDRINGKLHFGYNSAAGSSLWRSNLDGSARELVRSDIHRLVEDVHVDGLGNVVWMENGFTNVGSMSPPRLRRQPGLAVGGTPESMPWPSEIRFAVMPGTGSIMTMDGEVVSFDFPGLFTRPTVLSSALTARGLVIVDTPARPGTEEDFWLLASAANATLVQPQTRLLEVAEQVRVSARGAQRLEIQVRSVGGTFVGSPFFLFAQPFTTGGTLTGPAILPEVHLDFAALPAPVQVAGSFAGLSLPLLPGGWTGAFMPDRSLIGTTVRFQAVTLGGALSANGNYSLTRSIDVIFN